MKYKYILSIVFSIMLFTSLAFSQQAAEISAEKRAVISELLVVTRADSQSKEIMQAMFSEMGKMYPTIVDSLLESETNLTAAQKKEAKAIILEKYNDLDSRFNEKFIKAINFQDYMNYVFYPLYDKFFTTDELKELLAFYKTSAGQKFITTAPQLAGESMKMAQDYLLPRIDGLMKEVLDEDLKSVRSSKKPAAVKKGQ